MTNDEYRAAVTRADQLLYASLRQIDQLEAEITALISESENRALKSKELERTFDEFKKCHDKLKFKCLVMVGSA